MANVVKIIVHGIQDCGQLVVVKASGVWLTQALQVRSQMALFFKARKQAREY